MSFTFTASATLSGSVTPVDACIDEPNNNVIIAESTTPSFRVYSLANAVQSGSNYAISGTPGGIAMIGPDLAAVVSSNSGTINIVNTSTGAATVYTGGLSCPSTKNQVIAGDVINGYALAATTSDNTLVLITSGGTISQLTVPLLAFAPPNTVISKAGTQLRWLVGTTAGLIAEVDQTGLIHDSLDIQYLSGRNVNPNSGSIDEGNITGMAYDNNMLFIVTTHACFLVDYTTKTIIKAWSLTAGSGNPNICTCYSASG
jgi:hypothetical protein